jgi:hypothetical protein
MAENETPFACDMTAIPPDQRDVYLALTKTLFQAVEEVREVSNGYRFRLPNDTETLRRTAEFVALERLCCPFFGFNIEVEPDGSLWLSVTGREGVKPFIMAEIGGHLTAISGWAPDKST